MSTLEDILSFLQLDFLSLDCATGRNSYYTKVLAMSFAPIGAIVLNFLVCGWRMIEKARSSVVDRNNLQYEAAVKEQQQLQSNSSGFADEPKHIKSQSHDDSDGIELMPSPAKPLGAAECRDVPASERTVMGRTMTSDAPPRARSSTGLGMSTRPRAVSSRLLQPPAPPSLVVVIVGLMTGGAAKERQKIISQHLNAALLITYLVLPPVSMVQFQALNCYKLEHNGESYLRADSGISCDAPSYKAFQGVTSIMIIIYQSIPIVWFVLLWRIRRRLNPPGVSMRTAVMMRAKDEELRFCSILWGDFKPQKVSLGVSTAILSFYPVLLKCALIGSLALLL